MKYFSDIMIGLSVIAVVLSAIVSVFKVEMWLAGTQWMLVAIILGVYSIYSRGRA